ncbi:hypothetical protein D7S44_22835 [Pantoea piersonii]|nr:hypothetical protein D7S44_22835 [Pantoea piersonii]
MGQDHISVIQPLLRGEGRDIAIARVRLARLNEQINRLWLQLTVMQTVINIMTSSRELLRSRPIAAS